MEPFVLPPAVFHSRNRTLILVSFPPVAMVCVAMLIDGLRGGELRLNWVAALGVWTFSTLLAIRRRLVLTADGLGYTDFLFSAHYRWPQVTGVVRRKALGVWPVEGHAIQTGPPEFREVFVELTQFGRFWRQDDLGVALRARAPHLFG